MGTKTELDVLVSNEYLILDIRPFTDFRFELFCLNSLQYSMYMTPEIKPIK